MNKIMDKLIVKKWTTVCTLSNFIYVHYFEHYFLTMFITPKHLKLAAGGGLIGGFFNNLLEGYRTPVPIKITQNPPIQKPLKQGGARKVSL